MAVTISFYNNFIEDMGKKRVDLPNDTFKIMLVNGYTFSATHTKKADVSGEIANGNGYTSGGATLSGVTWSFSTPTHKFDASDVTWTATGGSLGPATGAVIYDDTITTPEADRLVCYIDFGTSEAAGDGTDFKITFNANGIFTIA